MIRSLIISILGLCVCTSCIGQDTVRWSLYTNITRNIDISHPRINLGVEMASGAHRYKVALAACYRSPYSQLAANGGSIDLSYQFPVSRRYDLTVGSSYGFVHYRALGNFAAPDLADQIDAGYEEYYDIDKTLFDVYVAMSKRINWSKTLWAQPFLGLGFRYKWVKQTGRSHPEDPFAGPDLNGLMLRDHISDFGVPTLRFGLLIGFRLGH